MCARTTCKARTRQAIIARRILQVLGKPDAGTVNVIATSYKLRDLLLLFVRQRNGLLGYQQL